MAPWLSAILGAVVNAVLPVVISWIQKLLPPQHFASVHGCPAGTDPSAHYRATVRQWVLDMVTEFGQKLTTLVPTSLAWVSALLQVMLPELEQLAANGIDQALDNAGL